MKDCFASSQKNQHLRKTGSPLGSAFFPKVTILVHQQQPICSASMIRGCSLAFAHSDIAIVAAAKKSRFLTVSYLSLPHHHHLLNSDNVLLFDDYITTPCCVLSLELFQQIINFLCQRLFSAFPVTTRKHWSQSLIWGKTRLQK